MSTTSISRLFTRLFAVFILLVVSIFGACTDTDPPSSQGAFLLGIRTVLPADPNPTLSGGTGETLAGLTGLRATVTRVEVVHRTVVDDPSTEQVITIDSTERQVQLQGNLQQLASRQIAFFQVPVGFIFQLRLIISEAFITVDGQEHSVKGAKRVAEGRAD